MQHFVLTNFSLAFFIYILPFDFPCYKNYALLEKKIIRDDVIDLKGGIILLATSIFEFLRPVIYVMPS